MITAKPVLNLKKRSFFFFIIGQKFFSNNSKNLNYPKVRSEFADKSGDSSIVLKHLHTVTVLDVIGFEEFSKDRGKKFKLKKKKQKKF